MPGLTFERTDRLSPITRMGLSQRGPLMLFAKPPRPEFTPSPERTTAKPDEGMPMKERSMIEYVEIEEEAIDPTEARQIAATAASLASRFQNLSPDELAVSKDEIAISPVELILEQFISTGAGPLLNEALLSLFSIHNLRENATHEIRGAEMRKLRGQTASIEILSGAMAACGIREIEGAVPHIIDVFELGGYEASLWELRAAVEALIAIGPKKVERQLKGHPELRDTLYNFLAQRPQYLFRSALLTREWRLLYDDFGYDQEAVLQEATRLGQRLQTELLDKINA